MNKSENMKCCCVILNYNDADTTIKLVNYIKNYKVFDHILIVDNCSTDNSLDELSQCTGFATIISSKKNGGYGAGNNLGIRYAKNELKCKYVLLCNPDIIYSEQVVQKLLYVMVNEEKCGIVSAVQYDINYEQINNIAWKIPSSFRYILSFSSRGMKVAHIHYSKDYFINKNVVDVDCVPGAMLLIDIDKFIEVGGYDERIFLYCEEDLIGYKMKQANYRTLLVTNLRYVHEHGMSINKNIKDSIAQQKLINHNKLLFMKDYLKANNVEMCIAYIFSSINILSMKISSMGNRHE